MPKTNENPEYYWILKKILNTATQLDPQGLLSLLRQFEKLHF